MPFAILHNQDYLADRRYRLAMLLSAGGHVIVLVMILFSPNLDRKEIPFDRPNTFTLVRKAFEQAAAPLSQATPQKSEPPAPPPPKNQVVSSPVSEHIVPVSPETLNAPRHEVPVSSAPQGETAPTGGGAGVIIASRDLSGVFGLDEVEEGGQLLSKTDIPYPERAKELGIEGRLSVIITVERNGTVAAIDIQQSPHLSISAEARRAIARWRFKPAKVKGTPVRFRAGQDIDFKLDEE